MEPLKIDVDFPQSSRTAELYPNDASYEIVNFDELRFPDFYFSKELGNGACGAVMRCHFRGRPAAAKLFGDNVNFKTIQEEAELLNELQHENIIKLFALFHGKMSGLILELMEGGSLSELIHQHKSIVYQTCHVANWAFQLANALGYLHKRCFVHRDVKPANMLLSPDYITLKLCDFGTAVKLSPAELANICGTAAWMAPEVFKGRRYDNRCDVFSFGICLWEMVARSPPLAEAFKCNPMAMLWEVAENGLRPPPIEGVAEQLQQLMTRCWADEPNDRPSMDEVTKTLGAFLRSNGAPSPLVGPSTVACPSPPADF